MEASFFLSPPLRDGRCGPMRGALPLGSKSADLAPTPRSGGAAPPRPHREGAPPHTPGVYAGLAAPAPTSGPTRPTPGVPFVSRRKEPKACRGCAPGPPEGGTLSPLRRCRTPQIGLSATKKDRFATLSCWANRSLFLPKLYRGSHPQLSIRGAAGMPSRMLEVLSYREQYR